MVHPVKRVRCARRALRALVQSCSCSVEDRGLVSCQLVRRSGCQLSGSGAFRAVRQHESTNAQLHGVTSSLRAKSRTLQNLFNGIENRVDFLIRDHIGGEKIENVAERTQENSSFQKGLSQPRASFVQVPTFPLG